MKLPVLSGLELVKILKKAGFEPKRQKGSHIFLEKISGEVKTTEGSPRAKARSFASSVVKLNKAFISNLKVGAFGLC